MQHWMPPGKGLGTCVSANCPHASRLGPRPHQCCLQSGLVPCVLLLAMGRAQPSMGTSADCLFLAETGRLPKASVAAIVLGALLVGVLAGLSWTVVCRW